MELYVDDTTTSIAFNPRKIEGLSAVSATIGSDPTVVPGEKTDDQYYITLPYQYVQYGGTRVINWTYTVSGNTYTRTSTVNVITPLVELADIKEIVGVGATGAPLTDEEAKFLERKVRYAIQDYTGQVFGTYQGTLVSPFKGDPFSGLTMPVIDATSVDYLFAPDQVEPYYNPKVDVIFYPSGNRTNYVRVTGIFGYTEVPQDVVESAKILVADYGCPDTGYRDKYIETVSVADWRLQFSSLTYQGTGNAVVDTVLSHYRAFGAVVI